MILKSNLSLILVLLLAFKVNAQQIAIPDIEFEKALINQGIDTGTLNGFISQADAENYTGTINISAIGSGSFPAQVTDLTGIEAFINITGIDASPNGANIQVIDLSNNTELTYLNLDNGSVNLSWLNLSNNTKLVEVRLSAQISSFANSFNSLNLSNLHLLETLVVSSAGFLNLSIADCTALTTISLDNCAGLSSINFSNNTALQNISLNSCSNLQSITSLPNVSSFTAADCNFTSLDLSAITNLTSLNLQNNNLNNLNIQNTANTNITVFNTTGNPNLQCIQVDDTAYATTNFTNIDSGTFFSNASCDLVSIPDTEFEKRLISIGVDTSGLLDGYILKSDAEAVTGTLNTSVVIDEALTDYTGIEAFVNITGLNAVNNTDRISALDLSQNILLEEVYLDLITDFSDFDFTANTQLKIISIDGDGWSTISNVNVTGLTQLEALTIVQSNFTNLDLSTTTNLKNLEIESSNNLLSLNLSNNILLENLSLYELNNLASINLSNLTALSSLEIEGTGLTTIDFTDASASISEISLINNSVVTTITHTSLPIVTSIQIQQHPLLAKHLDFSSAVVLSQLELNDNDLTGLNIQNTANTNLTIFNATGNPNLSCIQVDDIAYANTNFTNIDSGVFFNNASCDFIAIPDTEFEKRLISIGVDSRSLLDGFIFRSDAETVTGTLNTSVEIDGRLTDYTGIEAFINITGLNIANITDRIPVLDLSNNTELEFVDLLFVTDFENFDFTANTKLKRISVGGAHRSVVTFNVTGLTQLETVLIEASNNTSLDFSTNISLRKLELLGTGGLGSLDLSSNVLLEELNVSSSGSMTTINLSNLTTLTDLIIFQTGITNIDITEASATLENINIINNSSLQSVTLGNLPTLQSIRIERNLLLTSHLDFSSAVLLSGSLSLNDNNLSGLNIQNTANTNITNFDATGNPNLVCIQVDDVTYATANFTDIDSQTFFNNASCDLVAIPDTEFEKRLISIGVDSTSLLDGFILRSDAEAVTGTLNTAAVVDGQLTDYTGVEAFINITGLDIANVTDRIPVLDLSHNTELEFVDLLFVTDFIDFDFTANTKLKTINIGGAHRSVVTFNVTGLIQLETVYIESGNYTTLDLSTNISLKSLELVGGGGLVSLDVSSNVLLEELIVSNLGAMTTINLSNLTTLISLKIIQTGTTTIDITDASATLEDIDIITNTALSSVTFGDLPALRSIQIRGNPLLTSHLDFSSAVLLSGSLNLNDNNLSGLNIKNTANTNITNFNTTENPNLVCIKVDDVAYATTNFTNIDAQTIFNEISCDYNYIAIKVNLQGAMLGTTDGLMRDDLRLADMIPTTSPYSDGATTFAEMFTVTGPQAIVDWVWVELRDATDNTVVVTGQSALLQRDGTITDVDGAPELEFNIDSKDYYIAVKHRNHLGIMTENLIALFNATTFIDFTDANNQITYGTNAQTTFGIDPNTLGMWTGNANEDIFVQYSGTFPDTPSILSTILNDVGNFLNFPTFTVSGYNANDINMDGSIQYSGTSPDTPFILQNILAHPGNFLNFSTYQIMEQLPENDIP